MCFGDLAPKTLRLEHLIKSAISKSRLAPDLIVVGSPELTSSAYRYPNLAHCYHHLLCGSVLECKKISLRFPNLQHGLSYECDLVL